MGRTGTLPAGLSTAVTVEVAEGCFGHDHQDKAPKPPERSRRMHLP